MAVVAVLGLLVVLAAPSLSEMFISNRLSAVTNDFIAALNLARSEAMARGQVVTMRRCDSVSAATGCASASVAQDWSRGWYMFVDTNRNQLRSADEEIIRVGQALPAPVTMYANNGTGQDAISFCPDGRMHGADCGSGGNSRTILIVCHGNKAAEGGRSRSRAILVSLSGRIRLAQNDAAGFPLNAEGVPQGDCRFPSYPFGVDD
jgi:type IV fimbrial biogenesis protein FimT